MPEYKVLVRVEFSGDVEYYIKVSADNEELAANKAEEEVVGGVRGILGDASYCDGLSICAHIGTSGRAVEVEAIGNSAEV